MAEKEKHQNFDSFIYKGKLVIITNEWNLEQARYLSMYNAIPVSRAKQIISDLQDNIKRLEKD